MTLELTSDNFQKQVIESRIPVLVDFWTATCGPCRRLAPIVDDLSKEVAGQYLIGKIDVWDEPELAAQYRVSALPTLLIFQGGQVVNTLVGFHDKAALLKALRQAKDVAGSRN